jgi:hypothetical protein
MTVLSVLALPAALESQQRVDTVEKVLVIFGDQ